MPIGSGGEHDVRYADHAAYVFKLTNNRQFGYVVDQENDNRSNKLHLRPALPSEYLLRLGTQNVVFGDQISFIGILSDRVPVIVTAQPYADMGRPSQQEINDFISQCGFIRVPDEMMMTQFHSKPFWYRVSDSIIIGDTNPENFSRLAADVLVPIDVIIHPIPRGVIRLTAVQNGVEFGRFAEDSAG